MVLSCSCSTEDANVLCASSSSQVLKWYEAPLPITVEEFSAQIGVLIEQTQLLLFNARTAKFTALFDRKFIDDFLSCSRNHKLILKALTKKLVMEHDEAVKDNGLRDKEYKGDDSGLRRIRVTRGCRIDYLYETGKVRFMRYFDEGEYAKSL